MDAEGMGDDEVPLLYSAAEIDLRAPADPQA
jgi:hypothetical protein